MPLTLAALNAMDQDAFVAALGGIYEHSPWIAERVWGSRPFADRASLHDAMAAIVAAADEVQQLALLRAHPDLAGKAARTGALTDHSAAEQASAGLDRLSGAGFARFREFNDVYRARFGFPFIIAVKGHTGDSILAALQARLPNDATTERATALRQVSRIACLRLDDMIMEP